MNKIYWWCLLPEKKYKQTNLELIEEFLINNTPFKLTIRSYREDVYCIKPNRSYFKEDNSNVLIYGEFYIIEEAWRAKMIGNCGKWFAKDQILKVEKW